MMFSEIYRILTNDIACYILYICKFVIIFRILFIGIEQTIIMKIK